MDRCPATGKERFSTPASAYKRIATLSKRKDDRQDSKHVHGALSAYRCRYCHQWHCGHATKSPHKPRRVEREWRYA